MRVAILPPLPPEKQAYALARYSRSSDSIEDSLKWVYDHNERSFMKTYYFEYGHASIADLGHMAICFEGISDLAAQFLYQEQLIDSQCKSTRFQDMSKVAVVNPFRHMVGEDRTAKLFDEGVKNLMRAYVEVLEMQSAWLASNNPRPDTMDPDKYERTIRARALDVARYMLPMGTPTQLGIVASIRTVERMINRFLSSRYSELQSIGMKLVEACSEAPMRRGLWSTRKPDEFMSEFLTSDKEAAAPTLAPYVGLDPYVHEIRERALDATHAHLLGAAGRRLDTSVWKHFGNQVRLVETPSPQVEVLATLLYQVSNQPYDVIVNAIEQGYCRNYQALLQQVLGQPRDHSAPLQAFRAGHGYQFDVDMDYGGWRDMHRHRRCEQVWQDLYIESGHNLPNEDGAVGTFLPQQVFWKLYNTYQQTIETVRSLAGVSPTAAQYLLPFAHRVRCLFKMDLSEVQYIGKIRTQVKGHPSYRWVAWMMTEAARTRSGLPCDWFPRTDPRHTEPLIR